MLDMIHDSEAMHPDLDLYVGNRENHLLRFAEPEPGLFIAESGNVIRIALQQGYLPYSVVCSEKRAEDSLLQDIAKKTTETEKTVPVYVVSEDAAKKRLGYVLTDGISCAMWRKPDSDWRKILDGTKRIVVLENVENPTNVGAIFRTAAALGIDAVLLSPGCANPLYRRALRVSTGNALRIPWAYVGSHETEWQKTGISLLRDHGFKTVALALRDDSVAIDAPCLKEADRLALVMGNEGAGLCNNTLRQCDYVAKIPMYREVDSLNVAVAAGLAMWEIRK